MAEVNRVIHRIEKLILGPRDSERRHSADRVVILELREDGTVTWRRERR